MRIALLSTCAVPVPPRGYGGTELIVAELAKTLTRLGHAITVFATGDSRPHAKLWSHFGTAQWPPNPALELRHAEAAWSTILSADPPFDVVHTHQMLAVACRTPGVIPVVVTLHNEADASLCEPLPDVTYVAISRRQAMRLGPTRVCHVVHHGLDVDLYSAGSGAGGWLAFVGRFAPEKGPEVAIDVACEAGMPLRMGGAPHACNARFFETDVRPRLLRAGGRVRWDGEVSLQPKLAMLAGARATLFPIDWEEPFGLVMIESMLVGTPVLAFARGAAPEVVEDGITGFVVRDAREMVDRVRRIDDIDRIRCRERARSRWSSSRMALEYLGVYQSVAAHR